MALVDVAVPAAMDLVNVLVGDVEDRAVPVGLAVKDLADLPAVAVVVVPRVAHLEVAPAVLAVVVQKEALPVVEVGRDPTPSEC